jgi:hypothetical protein
MLSQGVLTLYDYSCPYTAAAMQGLIATFGWEQFKRPPYSPGLATSDSPVFLHLKAFLGGWRFLEVTEAVNMWFASQAALFYDAEIQKLILHYDKCLNSGGNCVRK